MTTATNAKQPATPRAKTISPKIEPEEIRDIEISKLTRLQVRVQTDPNVVERYMGLLMTGVELLMPVVYELPDGTQVAADGNHTLDAHEGLRHGTVRCRVRRGSRLDAIGYAGRENSSHGLPLTNLDKRRVVEMWFREPDGKNVTDAVIAGKCGVSGRFVGVVREELGAVADLRVNSKGKPMRVGTLNGSGSAEAPLALKKLQELGLLGVAEVVHLTARLAAHPDEQPLRDFVVSAEKIVAKGISSETHPELRERLNGHVRSLVAANDGAREKEAKDAPDLAQAAATDPALLAILRGSLDPKGLGGAAPTTPLPPDLLAKHHDLTGLRTFGDLADAARGVLGRGRVGTRGATGSVSKSGKITNVAVNLPIGAEPYRATVKDVSLRIGVASIKVPRAALRKALADSEDNGRDYSDPKMSTDERLRRQTRHDFPELVTGTVTLMIG